MYLEIAGIGAGAYDEPDATLGVLPGAAHEAAGGVVQYGAHLNVDVTTPRCTWKTVNNAALALKNKRT
jgi:hypothetical protein